MPRTERGKRAKDTYLQKSASKCNTLTSYISYKYLLVVMLISNALGPFSRRNSNRKTIFANSLSCETKNGLGAPRFGNVMAIVP